jgi:hypothetical protein
VSFAVLVLPWAAGLTAEDGARPETGDQAVAGDPDAAEPEGAPAPDEIRLQLEWDARSGTLSGRVGKQQSTSIADLVPAIRQSKEAHEKVLLSHPALKLGKKPFTVRIEAPADAPWRRVAEVVDLLKRQGFENIAFAEPGGNSRGQPWSRSFQRQGREYRVSLRNNEVTVSDSGDRVVWKTSLEVDTRNAQIDLVEQHGWLIVRSPDRQVFLDLATGKIVRQMGRGSPPGETPSPPAADRDSGLNPVAVDPQVEEMVTWQPPASRNALAASLHAPGALPGPPVDVVQLANSLIEARGAARLAKNKLETMADAAKAGVVSHGELAADKIRLETAEKKIDLLRRMATSTLKGIQVEMDGLREIEALAQRRYEAGQATEDAMLAVRMRRAHAETLVSLIEDILNE